MTPEERRQWLLLYLRGWIGMMNECCNGRNIHAVAQVRTSLNLWIGLLERDDFSEAHLEQIVRGYPAITARAHKLYSDWAKLKAS